MRKAVNWPWSMISPALNVFSQMRSEGGGRLALKQREVMVKRLWNII
jgi:hypothetical protein